ncbi:MAG: hypothetical protein ABSE66_03575 [Thermoplasmata archaeon]|jgi:hypothetical protein
MASASVGSLLLVAFVTLLVGVVGLTASGAHLTNDAQTPSSGPQGLAPASISLDCNKVGNPSPSALYIPTSEPTANLSRGGQITGTMEFAVVNYTSSDVGISVYFPTVYFTFPLAPTGNFSMTLSPQTLTITGSGWTNGAHTNHTQTVAAGLGFIPKGKDRLSTQKIAIQAAVPYGTLTLEFRWMWKVSQPNGTVISSSWTTPKSTYTSGSSTLPSIFFPAQHVQFISGPGNGQKLTIGTNYTALLGGPVAGKYFFLEMENGAGKVVQAHAQTIGGNVTTANVTIVLLNYDHYLAPGLELVHIHDVCGAILYNKLIDAVFAPKVTVTFYLQPGFCGPMTFNGTKFANGTSGTFVPSTTPYVFSVPKCTGYTFKNWADTGGLHISANDRLMVSYSGTFTIELKPR